MASLQSTDGPHVAIAGPSSTLHPVYKPLETAKREIRVLHVDPGEGDQLVCGILEYVSLSERPSWQWERFEEPFVLESSSSYETISYTWGDVGRKKTMRLNGSEVSMPASAVEVLQVFRDKTRERVLWIDAVCINQDDLDERASQVALMGDIYEAASATLVWLGHEDEHTTAAVATCREITEHIDLIGGSEADAASSEQLRQASSQDVEDLVTIFHRRWFERAWVLQEAALSRSCICWIGSVTIPWRSLILTALWLARSQAARGRMPAAVKTWAGIASALSYEDHDYSTRISLTSLMQATKSLLATDARDKIYALLALSFWRDGEAWGVKGLQPSYRITFRQCISRAIRLAIFEEHFWESQYQNRRSALTLLAEGQCEGDDSFDTESTPWPSWVRSASRTSHLDTATRWIHGPYTSGSRIPQDDDLIDPSQEHGPQGYDVLSLRGVAVDRVTKCLYEGGDETFEWLRTLLPYFESARNMLAFCAGDSDGSEEISAEDPRLRDFAMFAGSREPSVSAGGRRTKRASKMVDRIHGILEHRKVFQTSHGFLGIGPIGLREEDQVVVLFGGNVPFIIGDRGYGDLLIGPCFVRNLMRGEALWDVEVARRASRIFHLH